MESMSANECRNYAANIYGFTELKLTLTTNFNLMHLTRPLLDALSQLYSVYELANHHDYERNFNANLE